MEKETLFTFVDIFCIECLLFLFYTLTILFDIVLIIITLFKN
jgi:hypothetical protein